MKLTFGNMIIDLNIFKLEGQQIYPCTEPFEVNMIQGLASEFKEDQMDSDFGALTKVLTSYVRKRSGFLMKWTNRLIMYHP